MRLMMSVPNTAMKLLPDMDGSISLVLLHPVDRQLVTIARVPPTPNGEGETWAQVLAAAFMAYHALEALLEHCQPDGWDMFEEEGKPWKMAMRANCIAHGEPIPQMYAEDEPGQ